jgi:UDP:flavonoid glycosyltransferase YjiC (YdhE family)
LSPVAATEDSLQTTARMAWSGAGINLRTERPSPAKIRRAVRTVLSDSRYAEASARIGAEIANAAGLTARAHEARVTELRVPVSEWS